MIEYAAPGFFFVTLTLGQFHDSDRYTMNHSVGKWLRPLRILLSAVLFAILVYALTFCAGAMPAAAHQIERLQFLPAALGLSLSVFLGWLGITLLLGRIYCSSICPVGTLLDLTSSARRLKRPRPRYRYAAARNSLRYGALAVVGVMLMAGYARIPSLLEPYTMFSRIVGLWGAHPVVPAIAGATGYIVGASTFAALAASGLLRGRIFCNTLCPSGAILSLISRHAVVRIGIDTDLCIHCNRCVDACKAQCINPSTSEVDGSRCVTCFDCVDVCPTGAIRYSADRKQLATPLMTRIGGKQTTETSLTATK